MAEREGLSLQALSHLKTYLQNKKESLNLVIALGRSEGGINRQEPAGQAS